MLVLSRKNNQAVVVGNPNDFRNFVKVSVLEIKGGSVLLGFEAANDIPVHREEVWERIIASRALASSVGKPVLTVSRSGYGKTCVLSGMGKRRSAQPCGEQVCET